MISKFFSKWMARAVALLVLLPFLPGPALGQESKSLDVGALRYTTNAAFTEDDITWPRAQPATSGDMLESYGITIGVATDWTDPDGIQHPVKVAQVAHHKFTDQAEVVMPSGFTRTYRNPYPKKVLDGQDRTPILAQGDPVDPTIPADVVIATHATTWVGIDIERWAYAFASDDHDDYIILEYRFTNTSGESRDDVYFGLTAQTSADAQYPGDLWGTYYGATYAKYKAGSTGADTLRVWYSWDADENQTADTKGDPDPIWGNFREPQFMAYAVLHADESATEERDDPAQPIKAGWSQRELSPNLTETTHEEVYRFLAEGWNPQNPGGYAHTVDAEGNEMSGGMYRTLRPGVDLGNFDPVTEQEKTALLSFGPYQMQPGEDVRIVMAFAAGTIPHRLAIDAGRAFANGFSQQRPLEPLPGGLTYTDMHGHELVREGDVFDLEGNLLARAGETLTPAQKDAILNLGEQIVLKTVSRAARVWENASVEHGEGDFAVPLAPAAPSLTGFSENDQVRLEWGNEAESGADASTVVAYRIYRDYKRPPSITLPTDTTFTLLAEMPVGTYEYVDNEVVRGENYYYYVTAVTEEGVESSRFLNRTGTSATRTDEALTPTRAPDADWQQNIVVVPNPYHVRAAQKYPGKRLNFLNLPAYANIHIYTMTGDRIQTLEHDASTGDEDWERQDTFSTMEIVSGVYFFIVEELDGPRGSPTGQKAKGRFVVIK